MEIPSRKEIRVKNLFNVSEVIFLILAAHVFTSVGLKRQKSDVVKNAECIITVSFAERMISAASL